MPNALIMQNTTLQKHRLLQCGAGKRPTALAPAALTYNKLSSCQAPRTAKYTDFSVSKWHPPVLIRKSVQNVIKVSST